jgi:hypothetical protein
MVERRRLVLKAWADFIKPLKEAKAPSWRRSPKALSRRMARPLIFWRQE